MGVLTKARDFAKGRRWLIAPLRFFGKGFRADLLCLGLLWLVIFPYSARLNNPNERTRVLQSWAIVEHGQLHIGEAVPGRRGRVNYKDLHGRVHRRPFVNDVALVCDDAALEPPNCVGKIFPAKPPGVTLLGVPALWLARTLRFIEDAPVGEDGVTQAEMNKARRSWERVVEAKATWVLRYGGVAIPLLLCLLAFAALLQRAGLPRSFVRFALWTTALGTTVLPYGIIFAGHALAGAFLLASLTLLTQAGGGRRGFALALAGGTLAGWAVLLEYQAAFPMLAIAAWVVMTRDGRKTFVPFALGSGSALAVFAWIHQAMFQSPFKTGHFFLLTKHNREGQGDGFLGVDGFHVGSVYDHLFDTYMGIAPIMPWLFVGLVLGLVALLRGGPQSLRPGTRAALAAMPILSLLFVATLGKWRLMNGWSIGPRYLLASIVPMAAVAAIGWGWLIQRHRLFVPVCGGLALASMWIVSALTMTDPSPSTAWLNPFGELAVPHLLEGYGVRHIFMGGGAPSTITPIVWFFGVASLVALGALLWGKPLRRVVLASVLSLALAFGWTSTLAKTQLTDPALAKRARKSALKRLEGVGPNTEKHRFFPGY